MKNNIVFPKTDNSWGEVIAFTVSAGKDSFSLKKEKGKWIDVKVGEPIVTWDIPGFGTGEFKQYRIKG